MEKQTSELRLYAETLRDIAVEAGRRLEPAEVEALRKIANRLERIVNRKS